ncbi:hypothetical protein GCM10010840_32400 [Deinococcus aerolatus]|uniref:Uncharacterized protein n=1 Tax=Deinococcus aerolatus TaxID=522487 RepID=A0ABQ2GEE3_9DEIO|nr:hypothetical protein [Deinococcus aerolatus]GGL91789.1 hypothetical protein GCM10010840_32400 [Deinococcus aerolatus]
MLDNILNSVKRGAERVQRRGEEVAQVARLRLETFQLGRELEGHFARLGRAYHAGAEKDTLGGIQDEIRRVEQEISARERLISELDEEPKPDGEMTVYSPDGTAQQDPRQQDTVQQPAASAASPVQPNNRPNFIGAAPVGATEPNIGAAVPHPNQEGSTMTNPRPDKERLEQQRGEINLNQTDRSHHDASQGDYTSPDPTVQHADELLEPGDSTAGVALEAERDKVFRHDNMVEEGKRASENPDPLDL